jgi:hypothetical protein
LKQLQPIRSLLLVQEKDRQSANAINKIPIIPPLSAYYRLCLQQELGGNIISEMPTKQLIEIILNQTLVDKSI